MAEEVSTYPIATATIVTASVIYGIAWVWNLALLVYSNLSFKDTKEGNYRSRATWLQGLRMFYALGPFILSFMLRFGLGYMYRYDNDANDKPVVISFWYWIVTAVSFGMMAFDYAYESHAGFGVAVYHGTITTGMGLFFALALLHSSLVIPLSIFGGICGVVYVINVVLVIRNMFEKVEENKMAPYQRTVDSWLFAGMSTILLVYLVPWGLEPAIGNKADADKVTIGYIVLDCATRVVIPFFLWILHDRPKAASGKFLVQYSEAAQKNTSGVWRGAKRY